MSAYSQVAERRRRSKPRRKQRWKQLCSERKHATSMRWHRLGTVEAAVGKVL